MGLRGDHHGRGLQQAFFLARHIQLEIALCAERGEGGDVDPIPLGAADQLFLCEIRVALDLEHRRSDPRIAHQIMNQAGRVVAHADPLHEASIDQRFHRRPCLMQRHACFVHARLGSVRVEQPFRRISLLYRHEFQRDGEVDQIEIELLQLQVFERLAARQFDMFGRVERVPEFRGDPQLLARHQPFADRARQPFAGLHFVGVVGGAVEMAIARAHSLNDTISGVRLRDFPEAEADRGHCLKHVYSSSAK